MKLEDVNILNTERATFYKLKADLKAITTGKPAVQFDNRCLDSEAAMYAVRHAVLPVYQKLLDQCVTRLMMLGITEFPE